MLYQLSYISQTLELMTGIGKSEPVTPLFRLRPRSAAARLTKSVLYQLSYISQTLLLFIRRSDLLSFPMKQSLHNKHCENDPCDHSQTDLLSRDSSNRFIRERGADKNREHCIRRYRNPKPLLQRHPKSLVHRGGFEPP